jgi:hypothetical protein
MSDDVQRRIAERAFQLWEEQGRPEGHDYQNWLDAEAEILGPPAGLIGPSETDDTGATQTQGDPLAGPNAREQGRP